MRGAASATIQNRDSNGAVFVFVGSPRGPRRERQRPVRLPITNGRLSEKWPDETARKLVEERAVQDEDEYTRRAALVALPE